MAPDLLLLVEISMVSENVEVKTAVALPGPLFLPKGSIRALVGITLGACCWVIVFAGRQVPNGLLSLALAVLSYYFGLRSGDDEEEDGPPPVRHVSARRLPLFMPTGVVRLVLSLGFVISGIFLMITKGLDGEAVEFFVIFFGLIVGYVFAKFTRGRSRGRLWRIVHHIKGALVLIATACLAYLVLIGPPNGTARIYVTVLSATISFYYGSRS